MGQNFEWKKPRRLKALWRKVETMEGRINTMMNLKDRQLATLTKRVQLLEVKKAENFRSSRKQSVWKAFKGFKKEFPFRSHRTLEKFWN